MADKLTLDPDEAVILKQDRICYGGIFAGYTSDLILSNKAVILVKKGVFGNIKEILRFPLSNIKIYNEQAQAIIGKASNNGAPQLELYLTTGQENFVFESKRAINEWVEKINELTTGKKVTTANTNTKMAIPGSELIAKTLKDTFDTYKDAFGLKKKVEQVSCKCQACGASVSGVKGESTKCPYCSSFVNFE